MGEVEQEMQMKRKDQDIQRMQELLDLSDANNVKKDKIIKSVINRLDNDYKNITKTLQDGEHSDDYSRCRLKAYRTKTKEIKEYIENLYYDKEVQKI